MTFGQLKTFLEVVRHGSIRAAAASLTVTEPSVSAGVASLQRELGVALVERQGRGIRVTPAGEEFAGYASQILGLYDKAARRAREKAGQAAELRLSAVTTAGESLMAPILKLFRQRQPGVELWMEVGNLQGVFDSLLSYQVDLGIGGRPPDDGEIAGEPFLDNRLVVVGSPEHRLANTADFDAGKLAKETWLLREGGSGTRSNTEEFFLESGIEAPPFMTLGSNGAVKQAASAGLGVTLISTHAVAAELAAGTLARLDVAGTPLVRSWHVLYRSASDHSPSAEAFLELLRSRKAKQAVDEWFGTSRDHLY
ncbi:MAG TPA: LysR family transcriptional regulator [Actinomycetota bacterium]|nr:LysR family transcriptional regulator [Actinomycetota bacterium]